MPFDPYADAPKALQFHIALEHIAPTIWRRIRVPASYSMWDLHVAIQDAMGWLDYHLHAFFIDSAAGQVTIGIPTEDDFMPVTAGWEVPAALVFRKVGEQVRYVYDFGDDWAHTVKLEEVVQTGSRITKPKCVAGERACPPEDCGSVPGYENLVAALADPKHPEHAELKAWAPERWSAEKFTAAKVKFMDPERRLAMMMGDD